MIRYKKLLVALAMTVTILTLLAISASATELKTGIGIVDASGLRLRAAASTDSDIISTASRGDNVVIIRKTGDWYLVDYNLDVGYMSAEHLTFKEKENIELGNGKVNTGSVNMRATPSSDGALVSQLSSGEKAKIIGLNCGWYKVQYKGSTGYIRSDLLDLTEKPLTNGASASYTSVGTQMVNYSMNLLGIPYVWGGTTTKGFDCSGFTKYVYQNFGYTLNRTAAQQLNNGYKVTTLDVGDLVFFANTYASSEAATHVGIYIGNNQFIHSASGGVRITNMSDSFYASRYVGARRIF